MSAGVVLDTNIVLDLLVFNDDSAQHLRDALEGGTVRWLATAAMRGELERVLAYPKVAPRLADRGLTKEAVMTAFDRHASIVDAPGKAGMSCADADDQKFIDLAVAHHALLLSKDRDVLALKKRAAAIGVTIRTALRV